MKYLDNSLIIGWTRYALCMDEAEYLREMKRLRIKDPTAFLLEGKPATTHFFSLKDGNGEGTAIVCIRPSPEQDSIAIATLLVHEAVHIWQCECEGMGEGSPGDGIEAYSIQRISSNLMRAYVEQTQ